MLNKSQNVSRALVTIKHFNENFDKNLNVTFSGVIRGNQEVNSGTELKEFKAKCNGNYQSITDKLENEFKLRKAIHDANSKKTISIDGIEMTINDMLIYRQHILPKLSILRKQLKSELANNRRLYLSASDSYSKSLASIDKADDEAVKFLDKREKPSLFSLEEKIEDLDKKIEFFETEFDAVLTEVNPTLIISV